MNVNDEQSVLFIAVILESEFGHIFESDFSFVISVKDSRKWGNIGRCGMELFVHWSVQIHEHFSCCDCFEDTVFIIVIHVKDFPE